ncbi:MAG: TlpA family protein disulfide reductase [Candidatus Eremiobacteraeota bacterium]|nr:TlpA family protein disulfide reductase [Candidatus Eremiobacteraeota bacterium]
MSRRVLVSLFAVLLVGGALVFGPARPLVSHLAHALGLRSAVTPAQPGAPMPALALENLDGTPATLPQQGTVVYNVFASWCQPCNQELPDLLLAQKELKKRGVRFVGIDRGEPPQRVAAFVQAQGIGYPVLLDSTSSTARLLGARVIPETLIVQDGTVKSVIVGPTTASQLTRAVENV